MLPEKVCADTAARKQRAQSKESITSQRGKKWYILHPKIPTEHDTMPENGWRLLLMVVFSHKYGIGKKSQESNAGIVSI